MWLLNLLLYETFRDFLIDVFKLLYWVLSWLDYFLLDTGIDPLRIKDLSMIVTMFLLLFIIPIYLILLSLGFIIANLEFFFGNLATLIVFSIIYYIIVYRGVGGRYTKRFVNFDIYIKSKCYNIYKYIKENSKIYKYIRENSKIYKDIKWNCDDKKKLYEEIKYSILNSKTYSYMKKICYYMKKIYNFIVRGIW